MDTKDQVYLSVIIPAYNEEKRLFNTLREIDEYFSNQSCLPDKERFNYEIIVINDGSKDKTALTVERLLDQIKNLKLIDNKRNYGKGYVVRQGMLAAKGQYRIFTDADNFRC